MGKSNIIRRWVDGSLRRISIVDFNGFRLSKMYKRFRVKRFEKGIFYVIKFFI